MLAEVAYYQARQKMDDARKLIAEALAQLKLAAGADTRHARNANQMLTEVGPAADQAGGGPAQRRPHPECASLQGGPSGPAASQKRPPPAPQLPPAPPVGTAAAGLRSGRNSDTLAPLDFHLNSRNSAFLKSRSDPPLQVGSGHRSLGAWGVVFEALSKRWLVIIDCKVRAQADPISRVDTGRAPP